MSKPTPGPWVASEYLDDGRLGVLSSDNTIICGVSAGLLPADAKLIAAAPDLAEVLREIAGGGWSDVIEPVALARVALAKAGL